MTQMSSIYRSDPVYSSGVFACNVVRDRFADDDKTFGEMRAAARYNTCAMTNAAPLPSSRNTAVLRRKIAVAMSKGRPRLAKNFEHTAVTPAILGKLVNLIDYYIFGGDLISTVNDKLPGTNNVVFAVFNDAQLFRGAQVVTAGLETDEGFVAHTLELSINLYWYTSTTGWNMKRTNNGVENDPSNKIDDLIVSLSHEMIHLALNVDCYDDVHLPTEPVHGPTFKKLNTLLNGFEDAKIILDPLEDDED